MPEGVLLIDKPGGITSYDVIRVLKKRFPGEKIGHAGTLDPMATGLLVIGLGRATKLLSGFLKKDKEYLAEIELGIATDTGDKDGKVVAESPVPELSEGDIEKAVKSLEGEIDLVVPAYSAIKKNGKPLYEYARKGIAVDAPVKTMKVIEVRYLLREGNVLKVSFFVSSGTYIRALAEELGRRLGTAATLSALRRTKVGDSTVEEAEKI